MKRHVRWPMDLYDRFIPNKCFFDVVRWRWRTLSVFNGRLNCCMRAMTDHAAATPTALLAVKSRSVQTTTLEVESQFAARAKRVVRASATNVSCVRTVVLDSMPFLESVATVVCG